MSDIILAVLIFSPVIITFILKSNAALAYLTLSGVFTLLSFGSADLKQLTGRLDLHVDSSTINLILLIVPLILTLLLTRRAFKGQLKTILNLLTALATGTLLALISVPLLNASSRADFADDLIWQNLQKIQTPVVAAGLLLSLFLVWLGNTNRSRLNKHRK